MGANLEKRRNIPITSAAISKLTKEYRLHVIDCLNDDTPMLPLDLFYREHLRKHKMNRSRLYEAYLSRMSIKSLK